MADYKMYLGVNGGEEGFILPVNPEEIRMDSPSNNKNFEVINLGEITKLQLPKPKEISFKSYFPLYTGPYINTDKLFTPAFYINLIEKWRVSKKYIRFIFIGGPIEVNDLFSIEDFKYGEVGGAVGDIEFEIKIKSYVLYAAKKVVFQNSISIAENKEQVKVIAESTSQRPVEKPAPKQHVVKPGDSLWGVAKKYLGNGSRYPEIAKLNNIKNPDLIYDGQTIILP